MAVLGLLLSAHAQEREITGSVKDHAGAGIVGATILVEGTTKGTTSGADGSFSIKAAPDNVLVVSFMGYQSHTIKVGTQTRIDVVLKENTQAIDDVIVVVLRYRDYCHAYSFSSRTAIGVMYWLPWYCFPFRLHSKLPFGSFTFPRRRLLVPFCSG